VPNITIYIRKEDWDKWLSLNDKPNWLHEKLNEMTIPTVRYSSSEDLNKLVAKAWAKTCKHGYDPKLCKFAKGGKPCQTK
jgi:hypothetical protein